MKDKTYQARVAALSLSQCTTVVNLLRAHQQEVHAENMEAAINVVASLISNELGRDTLAQAMSWVSDELGGSSELSQIVTTPH